MDRMGTLRSSKLLGAEGATGPDILELTDTEPFVLGSSAPLDISDATIADGTAAGWNAADTDQPKSGRLFDVTVATLALILVLPLLALCAIVVVVSSRGPVLFRQIRIGRSGREFTCLKLRTMANGAEYMLGEVLDDDSESRSEWLALQKLSADPRVTSAGHFMRRYCLDELPQLFNVLSGDMSMVGPRPIVADEIKRYGPRFADYCSVKPGITGLWQVSGSHALPYSERVRLDAEYARSKSLRLDLVILLRTVRIVALGDNR